MSWGGVDSEKVTRPDPSNIDEAHKKNAELHKLTPESVKSAGVEGSKRPPGHNPGGTLHQQRIMPFSYKGMTIAGLAAAALIGYGALYSMKKPEADAVDVAKVAVNAGGPEETRPKK